MDRHILFGVIREDIMRPSKEIVDKFRAFSVARIARATGGEGVLHPEIKPIHADTKICGPAVTMFGRQGDANMFQGSPDSIQPGDVLIVDAQGVKTLSVCGERVAYNNCHLAGAAGIVVDGSIRDKAGMEEEGIAVFFRGVDPKLYGATGPGAINVTIQCGGVLVNPGDLVVGDRDGVIVIPQDRLEEVYDKLEGQNDE